MARTCTQTAISVIRQSVNQAVASPTTVPGERRSKPQCAGRPEGRHVSSRKPLQGFFVTAGVCGHCRLLMHRSRSRRDGSLSRGLTCHCHPPPSDGRGRNAGVLQVAIRRCGQRSGPVVNRFLCRRAFRSQPAHASWSGRSRYQNAHMCAGRFAIPSCSSLYMVANLCYRSPASGWRYSASLLCAIASSSDCGAASGLSESST